MKRSNRISSHYNYNKRTLTFLFRKHKNIANRRTTKENTSQNNYQKFGTWSDRIGVIVSIAVAVFTLLLFYKTKESTDAAIRSANSAEAAIAEQKRNDSISQRAQEKFFIIDSINNENRQKIDSLNLQTQINNLRQTQQTFDIVNRPFIELISTTVRDSMGKFFLITFDYVNTGNFPAKLIKSKVRVIYEVDNFMGALKHHPDREDKNVNYIVSKNSHIQYESLVSVTEFDFNLIKKEEKFIYLYNDFEYVSLANSKHYLCSMVQKIYLPNFVERLKYTIREIK